jgi:hypothetical protein
MRHAALAILIACLGIPAAPAADLSKYSIEIDDPSGEDYGGYDDLGGDGFYETMMEFFYEETDRSAPGEPREYPRPYDPNPCGDDEECFEPADFFLPTCEGEYCG